MENPRTILQCHHELPRKHVNGDFAVGAVRLELTVRLEHKQQLGECAMARESDLTMSILGRVRFGA